VIVLDTNVLSEPLRTEPDANVIRWLSGLEEDVRVTSVSAGELLTGVALLPPGRRRTELSADVDALLDRFSDRVLPYDVEAARAYAELRAARRQQGVALSVEDGMIAAICRVNSARLATRNVRDFEGLGLGIVDPWSAD
jgi:predicted nucleic acid-binding protein